MKGEEAAGYVRDFLPADMSLDDADRLAETLEAPWGLRIEKAIREVLRSEQAGTAITRALADKVKELGLQPWKAPEPLPPIDLDEVVLVVWMGVERET